MKRFFCDNRIDDTFLLEGDEYNHAVNVMRLAKGDRVVINKKENTDFIDYVCEIEEISKRSLSARIVEAKENCSEPSIHLTVFQAITKSDKMELIAQKLNELGASEFVPYISSFTVVRPETTRLDRLEKITTESSKQCARASIMKIRQRTTFEKLVDELSGYDLKILAYENEDNLTLKTALNSKPLKDSRIALIIGSEGGFSREEVALARERCIEIVSLGKRILRAETAAIAATAMVMYESEQ